MINVKKVGSWAVISYSVVFGLLLGFGIVKESIDYLRLPPSALMTAQFANLDQEREVTNAVEELREVKREAAAVTAVKQRQETDKSSAGDGASGSDVEQPRR
jgi:hypothetical protein